MSNVPPNRHCWAAPNRPHGAARLRHPSVRRFCSNDLINPAILGTYSRYSHHSQTFFHWQQHACTPILPPIYLRLLLNLSY